MKKRLANFFSMTRNERIGAYGVLAIVCAISFGVNMCNSQDDVVPQEVLEEIDKAEQLEESIKKAKMDTLKKTKKKSKGVQKTNNYEEKALEEVPQY